MIEGIYLHCFNRLFKIASCKKGHSYALDPGQKDIVLKIFDNLKIPYMTELQENLCLIDFPSKDDPSRASACIIFEVDGQEYKISNYNSYLIKPRYADLINKALINRGIKSYMERVAA
jgi:hypothetical protein